MSPDTVSSVADKAEARAIDMANRTKILLGPSPTVADALALALATMANATAIFASLDLNAPGARLFLEALQEEFQRRMVGKAPLVTFSFPQSPPDGGVN
jgi:hypothetical protein